MNWKDEIEQGASEYVHSQRDQPNHIYNFQYSGFKDGANWMLEKLQPYIDFYEHMKKSAYTEEMFATEKECLDWHKKYDELVSLIEELKNG
jgi:hypothetical protein